MTEFYSLDQFYSELEKLAPIKLSHLMIEKGCYDNSGILIRTHDDVKKVMFTLDLSERAIKRAKKLGVDTIVTHHPAIYAPIKTVSTSDDDSYIVALSVKMNLNVISMHLNLDIATDGIDSALADKISKGEKKIISKVAESNGYGREFLIEETSLKNLFNLIKKEFSTDKAVVYGNKNEVVKSVASFCGAGSSDAVEYVKNSKESADVIVTSDAPHHAIKFLIEKGKKLILLPHYVAEEVGFKKYFENISIVVNNKVKTLYFDDERFR